MARGARGSSHWSRELGLAGEVDLPGFVPNPYPLIARAALFVLSSAWEGSPNVLTEALALGVPAVSTDCPSGPAEILGGGRYGPLVPVGDVAALAEAMERTLAAPLAEQRAEGRGCRVRSGGQRPGLSPCARAE